MGNVSAVQHSLGKAKALAGQFAAAIEIGPDEPDLVWVVFSGEKVVGVFKDWDSASAKVGEILQVQLKHWLDAREDNESSLSRG
ncbi:hypothetical protein [Pseudomonas putida]|uniref:hypothetical protein n=1 Tax=Pseudomonas putida TaxID=303 RepID=UPI000D353903|nr:hypothetical protein [Pseudomonas putida]PTV64453.1 hypothetical protein DBL03_05770 [Pseudomonas putida]